MQKFTFPGSQGHDLAARLDTPDGPVKAYALFAHCFTCTKDIYGASQIAKALTKNGIAVLRFDFTGLGASEGEFENTNFTSNVQDLIAAANHMKEKLTAPSILVGHSLGGAAVLVAAKDMPEVKAIATIGAPADAAHVAHHFQDKKEEIYEKGKAEVCLVGRPFIIQRQFFEDIESQNMIENIADLNRPLLVMHAPLDQTVGVDNAAIIFKAAKHPKSYISLDEADHLLSNKSDAVYAADVIAAWASRYIDTEQTDTASATDDRLKAGIVKVAPDSIGGFQQNIQVGNKHHLIADEPADYGGGDKGPTPYDFLKIALGTCTAMTLQMYAKRKKLALENLKVYVTHDKIHGRDCEECDTKETKIDEFVREIVIEGGKLTPEERARLIEIADKCPVHKTLESEIIIRTKEIA